MKRLTSLGVPVVAVAAIALGGAASSEAGSVCSYNNQFHITKRHHVSCKFSKKVLKDYLNNGSVQHHSGWHCPNPYNDQLGKCWKGKKSDPDASFRYKGNY